MHQKTHYRCRDRIGRGNGRGSKYAPPTLRAPTAANNYEYSMHTTCLAGGISGEAIWFTRCYFCIFLYLLDFRRKFWTDSLIKMRGLVPNEITKTFTVIDFVVFQS